MSNLINNTQVSCLIGESSIRGSFSIRELVANWQKNQYSQPQIWLDLSAYRQDKAVTLDNWYLTQGVHTLLQNPLVQPLPWTEVVIPQVTVPAIPSVSLSIQLPTLAIREILTTATRLAYGISLASFLFFLGPIIILEAQQSWKNLQTHLGDSRVYSAEEPQRRPITRGFDPSPEPYASAPEDIFSLRIPDLDIQSNIVPNVDSTDKNSYTSALKEGIAHAASTGFPDQLEENKTVYLFAHSTDASWNIARYNAQFYALKDAEVGQVVHVRFWNEDYTYRITEKKIISADDTSYMEKQTEKEQLILQTCYPPGTTWKRLLIIAVPEKDYIEPESHKNTIDDIDKKLSAQYNTPTV